MCIAAAQAPGIFWSSKPFHYKLKKEELKETLDIADEDSEIFRRMLYVDGLLLEYDVVITII